MDKGVLGAGLGRRHHLRLLVEAHADIHQRHQQPDEDDGDASFPPDNGDGVLFPGIAPYLTLWSNEMNTSADGRPRFNLNMKEAQDLQTALAQVMPPHCRLLAEPET